MCRRPKRHCSSRTTKPLRDRRPPSSQAISQASVPGYPTETLPPGVYKSTSTVSIESGNLTLDGLNNPQSIFIFQVASSLTTSLNGGVGANIILENRANPCNIYWQIGSSAVLSGNTFYGNVLAYAAITIEATTFDGRALARNAAVSIPVAGGSTMTNPGGSEASHGSS